MGGWLSEVGDLQQLIGIRRGNGFDEGRVDNWKVYVRDGLVNGRLFYSGIVQDRFIQDDQLRGLLGFRGLQKRLHPSLFVAEFAHLHLQGSVAEVTRVVELERTQFPLGK